MNNVSQLEARTADWIARRDGDRWTAAEQQAFDAWLAESPLHMVTYLRLNAAWQRGDRLRALRSSGPPTGAEPVPLRPIAQATRRPAFSTRGFRVAAGAVAFGAVVGLSMYLSGAASRRDYATPIGAREIASLDDGSKLTLNTATHLTTHIDANERMVWLEKGEAFFDVAHDPSRPFVIVAGNRRVTVVGTRFSLRRDGDRLNVDVIEGRVQVQAGDAAPTLLSGGDSAVGEGRNVLVTRRTEQQLAAATGWLNGRLIFDQMTIAEAANQFNRYNRKKLVVADPAAAAIRIGGSFDATNVEGFVRLIQSGFGLTIDRRDNRVVISSVAQ